jgi:hypothetical protein
MHKHHLAMTRHFGLSHHFENKEGNKKALPVSK